MILLSVLLSVLLSFVFHLRHGKSLESAVFHVIFTFSFVAEQIFISILQVRGYFAL